MNQSLAYGTMKQMKDVCKISDVNQSLAYGTMKQMKDVCKMKQMKDVNQSLAYGTMKQMKDVCKIIYEPITRIWNNDTDERRMQNHM